MPIDDEAARKARAEAIRRARDRYNNKPAADAPDAKAAPDPKPGTPNYAAWIEKKMRDDRR